MGKAIWRERDCEVDVLSFVFDSYEQKVMAICCTQDGGLHAIPFGFLRNYRAN